MLLQLYEIRIFMSIDFRGEMMYTAFISPLSPLRGFMGACQVRACASSLLLCLDGVQGEARPGHRLAEAGVQIAMSFLESGAIKAVRGGVVPGGAPADPVKLFRGVLHHVGFHIVLDRLGLFGQFCNHLLQIEISSRFLVHLVHAHCIFPFSPCCR